MYKQIVKKEPKPDTNMIGQPEKKVLAGTLYKKTGLEAINDPKTI